MFHWRSVPMVAGIIRHSPRAMSTFFSHANALAIASAAAAVRAVGDCLQLKVTARDGAFCHAGAQSVRSYLI